MKKNLLKKLLFVHLAIISFGLIFSNFAFATNRKMNPQDISAETEKMEMLQSEVQNLILKIENLEHSVSVLNGKSENQGDKNSTETTSVEKISPSKADSSLGSDLEANTSHESALPKDKKPSNNNEKSEYQDALICLKEAGAIKIIDEREEKLNEAEEKFKNFIAKYKDSTLIPNAHFWYGEIFFQRKDYNKAAVQYLKSYKISKEKNITKNNKAPDSLLKLALSLSELRKNKDACGILDKLTQEFPKRTEEIIKKEREIRIKLGCK